MWTGGSWLSMNYVHLSASIISPLTFWIFLKKFNLLIQQKEKFNNYPAGTESDWSLPVEKKLASLHIHAVWPVCILLADQLQILILISLKMIIESPKTCRWITQFKKFSRLRVKIIKTFELGRIDFPLSNIIDLSTVTNR